MSGMRINRITRCTGRKLRIRAMENFTDVKLEIFVPQEHALKIRDELAKIGVGRIGNYDHCVALTPVQGYFRPMEGANPFEGEVGKISETVEYKVEVMRIIFFDEELCMPTKKEALDYLGEFLMKYHRDQSLFTLETASKEA